jgi:hypothetical protein
VFLGFNLMYCIIASVFSYTAPTQK